LCCVEKTHSSSVPATTRNFGPLKVALDNRLVTKQGKAVSQRHVNGFLRAATIQEAEHALVATGIYTYRPNIVSGEDFEPSEITRKVKMADEHLEGTEDAHSDVDGPNLPTLVFL
jgi:hypothetical protein